METQGIDIQEILSHVALQAAAEGGLQGLDHGSMICRLPSQSWHADNIGKTPGMAKALNPSELRRMMRDPRAPVIFIPLGAFVTKEIINDICAESPLNKTLVWAEA